eukprot:TRINITY_DN21973_c0_g1_i1.p1 TRINITY_DN21973_c0_g1~~TRINITY_DN21973_c0_g1_i1.p1  ORF type:complete len:104 (+),score=15.73 TRINITY_DN21973_c0_g1_i1:55-366(+)
MPFNRLLVTIIFHLKTACWIILNPHRNAGLERGVSSFGIMSAVSKMLPGAIHRQKLTLKSKTALASKLAKVSQSTGYLPSLKSNSTATSTTSATTATATALRS